MPPAPVLIVLIVYGAALLGIGLWGRRESRTVAGYFIAGKRLPGVGHRIQQQCDG